MVKKSPINDAVRKAKLGAQKKAKLEATKSTRLEAVRKAMNNSGLSVYKLADNTGLNETSLSRFRAGETDLLLANGLVLMESLGFEIVPPRVAKGTNPSKAKG